MYKSYIENYVCGFRDLKKHFPENNLHVVSLTEEEKKNITSDMTNEEMIIQCSSYSDQFINCTDKKEIQDVLFQPQLDIIEESNANINTILKILVTNSLLSVSLQFLNVKI